MLTAKIYQGARIYHLRAILHDYPTPICRTILSHIADAMTPNYSRLIIREFILPDTKVPLYTACTDIRMMLLHAGMGKLSFPNHCFPVRIAFELPDLCQEMKTPNTCFMIQI